jgi:hypothetical protein
MIAIGKIKGRGFKKLYVSESIAFEASVENTKTSKVIPEDQIEFVYDVKNGKIVQTPYASFKKK